MRIVAGIFTILYSQIRATPVSGCTVGNVYGSRVSGSESVPVRSQGKCSSWHVQSRLEVMTRPRQQIGYVDACSVKLKRLLAMKVPHSTWRTGLLSRNGWRKTRGSICHLKGRSSRGRISLGRGQLLQICSNVLLLKRRQWHRRRSSVC